MNPLVVKVEIPALDKLIETAGSFLGTWYKPKSMPDEADAKAYEIEKIAAAEGRASMIRADSASELLDRAKQRFIAQEVSHQLNIEAVVEGTEKYLGEHATKEPVDLDWRMKFFTKVQDVSTKEMQDIWSRILAKEVTDNKSVSLKTLEILSGMTKREGELFETACSLANTDGYIFKDTALAQLQFTYSDVLELASHGLLHPHEITCTIEAINPDEELCIEYRPFLVFLKTTGRTKFALYSFMLTPQGLELFHLINPLPSEFFLADFEQYLKSIGYSVRITSLER